MSIEKLPEGTRGAHRPPRLIARLMMPMAVWFHHRSHDRMRGMDLLYLTTIGAKTGQKRTVPLARFDDGGGGWIVVAAAAGTPQHPGWYHNLAAHPDAVYVEVAGKRRRVAVVQLAGPERDAAWAFVVGEAPGFSGYEKKTDRELPVLRLLPTS